MWEHRTSARFAASAAVLLRRQGVPVVAGEIRNVSRDGLFIAADPVALDRHEHIELQLLSLTAPPLPALVVHCTPQGVGVLIDGDDTAVAALLLQLVQPPSGAVTAPDRWRPRS